MAQIRYIDGAIWDDTVLRRLGMVARHVFVFLFSRYADDEGRFELDAYAIWEGAFGRQDPVTEDQVAEVLGALAEGGMLLRYGDADEYGFLTGWYSHQKIDRRYRRESKCPAPPVDVNSWARAEEVREAYMEAHSLSGSASFRDALAWHTRESRENPARTPREPRAGKGKGKGKGNQNDKTSAPDDGAAPEKTEKQPRQSSKAPEDEEAAELHRQRQQRIDEGWSLFGYEGNPSKPAYARCMKILKAKGFELCDGWLNHLRDHGRPNDEGGDPSDFFADQFHIAHYQPFTWRGKHPQQPQPAPTLDARAYLKRFEETENEH